MHAALPPSGFACHPPPGLGQKICHISVCKHPAKQKFIAPFLSKSKCCCPARSCDAKKADSFESAFFMFY